ncbi:hypothetical protein D3C76_1403510 [compost metagenome]
MRSRSITFCASILRSLIGFRRTSTKALLVPLLPPMKPATLCTAGSASKARRYTSIFGCITLNDRPSSPRMKPINWPVSCCGISVLGTTTYKAMLMPMVASRLNRVRRLWRKAQPRLRS